METKDANLHLESPSCSETEQELIDFPQKREIKRLKKKIRRKVLPRASKKKMSIRKKMKFTQVLKSKLKKSESIESSIQKVVSLFSGLA